MPQSIPQGEAEKGAIQKKDIGHSFLGLSRSCASCHADQHNGRLGTDCTQCHNANDWKATQRFDHGKTRFALTGLHANVACAKCHTPGANQQPRWTGIAFDWCSACHTDVHKGSFPQGCAACHNTGGWKKVAAAAAVSAHFDHAQTHFPLRGKHAGVNCAQCHASGDFKKPVAFAKCTDCHKLDPPSGQFSGNPSKVNGSGECSACHSVDGWKLTTFTVALHASTKYPLEAKHATVACGSCHIPVGKEAKFKISIAQCNDCHKDGHQGQFAGAPNWNHCDRCHTVQGYAPSTFTLDRHKETRFLLTGGHVATPCVECHKPAKDETVMRASKTQSNSSETRVTTSVVFHFSDLACAQCHQDPHQGQFSERMAAAKPRPDGSPAGCLTCHSTKSWKELTGFDHETTNFKLVASHRAVACAECHRPSNLETTLKHVDFRSAPTQCEACHQDADAAQFVDKSSGKTSCADCHNVSQWKPSLFDHNARTSFALTGFHRDVRCARCHSLMREISGKPVLFYQPTPKQCAACHGADIVALPRK